MGGVPQYGFDAFYCKPGIDGAHEKGGVEGEGGRFRRNHCVPMPVVDSIAQLKVLLAAADVKDAHRASRTRRRVSGATSRSNASCCAHCPARRLPRWLTLTPRVDRYARVMVRCCQYSVPARFIGRGVRVRVSASALAVFDGCVEVPRH